MLLAAIPLWLLPDAKVDLTLLWKNNNSSTQQYIDRYHGCVNTFIQMHQGVRQIKYHLLAFVIPEFNVKEAKRVSRDFETEKRKLVMRLGSLRSQLGKGI